jgi:AcrR family transcriptional regulator
MTRASAAASEEPPAPASHAGSSGARGRIPYAVAARELLRNTLLDAARDELQSRRWTDITMADIARAAGVSRQTLYNEFRSREDFAQVLVMRESDRFLVAVEQAVGEHRDDPSSAISAAFDVFLTAASENALVSTIVDGDGAEELLALFTTQGKPIVERAAEHLTAVLIGAWPLLDRHDAELLSECLVRLAISYAALPKGPASMTAASIAELLGPYVEKLLSGVRPRA